MCEICSNVALKTQEGRHWSRSSAFIPNFEHITYLFPLFLLHASKMLLLN